MGHNNHRLNYLLITELFSPTYGGSAIWFDKVYRILGDRATHIVTSKVPNCEAFDVKYPCTIHRLKLTRRRYFRPESLGIYIYLFIISLKLALANKFHSIHAGRVLPEGLIAYIISRFAGKPCVIYAHGEEITTWIQPLKRSFLLYLYRHADVIIANSDFTRSLLLNLGAGETRVHLIYPGVDLSLFRPSLSDGTLVEKYQLKKKRIILSVGRLSRRKGFDNVIKAMPLVLDNHPDVHYVIIGRGEDEEYLKKLVTEYRLQNQVTFAGLVPQEYLPLWYNLCEIFVMPNRSVNSDTEGFGMVFVEANACGKSVIAGIDGGTSSSVIDGVTGLRINGDETVEIAGAIIRLLDDRNFSTRLGAAGLERAFNFFGWDKVAEKTYGIFKLLEKKSFYV